MEERTYIAIDLKSFYASVECVERGLDPMTTNLVVADAARTEKTICLAVSPALKAQGIPGRARLFEVVERVRQLNAERLRRAPGHALSATSYDAHELRDDPSVSLDYIVAPPRMGHYIECSTRIYDIYLKYVAPEDVHVYSIDEVFIDATAYLRAYALTAREFTMRMILDVLGQTGITATAGIGPNLYLCKIAMDIQAKHIEADKNGVRIAELDEMSYRRLLWDHKPLTDFWRIGRGYAKRLADAELYTMGDIARCSLGKPNDYHNEALLYKMFGVNAELLIDHAWGWEPCTIADIKAYKPSANSISSGQVLQCPYAFEKARLVMREMADALSLELVDKGLVTDQVMLTVGYDIENLKKADARERYAGATDTDRYGRVVPKPAHGTQGLKRRTSSSKLLIDAFSELFDRIVDPALSVRRMYVVACRVVGEHTAHSEAETEQLDLFTDYEQAERQKERELAELERERKAQEAILAIKRKYGKNAILKGIDLEDGATAISRNKQIGGHKA